MQQFVLAVLSLAAAASSAGTLVGEWSISAQECATSRMTFTDDGWHEAMVYEAGEWLTLASARYRQEADLLTIQDQDSEERLRLMGVDGERLVLRNEDEAVMQSIGSDWLELVRCPPR